MNTVTYIQTASRDAAFHFSVEEYIMGGGTDLALPVMMLWQTDKCAMLGHNQVAAAEISLGYAQKHGVQTVRRSSGGGTIFTDGGTLLYTLIIPWPEEGLSLRGAMEQTAIPLVNALNAMGVPATLEGRNDVLVNGKKVSGFAQYTRSGRLCTHGSLLYDADLASLAALLKPDREKISSKALPSVKSRVTNIKEHLNPPLSVDGFIDRLKTELFKTFMPAHYTLTDSDLNAIQAIYDQKYGNPLWTTGNTPKFTFSAAKRFDQGRTEVYLEVVKGITEHCCIRGDFLGTVEIRALEHRLENLPFDFDAVSGALDGVDLVPYLGGITKDQLLSVIFERSES